MPSAGYSHFYHHQKGGNGARDNVSMPSAGYSHFYLSTLSQEVAENIECQCPRRAILISTKSKRSSLDHAMCQCPRRAILISTEVTCQCRTAYEKGVNALGGLFSFLRSGLIKRTSISNIMVSMPSAGYSHFY